MSFFSPLRRFVRGRARRQHDLDVTDQWLLLTLERFHECSYRRLEAELQAIRGVSPAEVVASLLKLEHAGLLERKPVAGLAAEERRFRLTHAGTRVGRLVPAQPRSPTIFYE